MKELYPGEQGTDVSYLQLALRRAGADVQTDGIFGEKTCRAVEEFFGSSGTCAVKEAQWNRLLPFLRGDGGTEPIVPEAVLYSSQLVSLLLDGLAARYPYVPITTIGESALGTPLWCLRLGNGPVEVSYNASFHANESITTPVLLKFAEQLLRAYTAGTTYLGVDVARLFESCSLYLVPLVNPDGVDLVNGTAEEEAYRQAKGIAEAFPDISFPDGWKANIRGIDLNLQFPAGWEIAREIKYEKGYDRPAPRDFVGYTPLSAPESIAMYEFTRAHAFSLILAYHTQGEVIYWKYLDYEPEGAKRIADEFARVSGYRAEETPSASGYAGYKDWFIKTYDRCGYTIEAGLGENPLPMEQFARIYEQNTGILLGGMTELI